MFHKKNIFPVGPPQYQAWWDISIDIDIDMQMNIDTDMSPLKVHNKLKKQLF